MGQALHQAPSHYGAGCWLGFYILSQLNTNFMCLFNISWVLIIVLLMHFLVFRSAAFTTWPLSRHPSFGDPGSLLTLNRVS